MKLQAFRIKYFRSIKDSDWCNTSPDNITALIGQNEAGKTSVLEALYAFYTGKFNEDFRRLGSDHISEVSISFLLDDSEIEGILEPFIYSDEISKLLKRNHRVNLTRVWTKDGKSSVLKIEEKELDEYLDNIQENHEENQEAQPEEAQPEEAQPEEAQPEEAQPEEAQPEEAQKLYRKSEFINAVEEVLPEFVLFEDFTSILQDKIDIEIIESNKPFRGKIAAKNFLKVADIDIGDLKSADPRREKHILDKKSGEVSRRFQKFWKTKLGETITLNFACDLRVYGEESPEEKRGKKYLQFWMKEGNETLYPRQLSKGVVWFLSFFLQLQATKLESKEHDWSGNYIYLLDEPGGSLHGKAQENVLSVLEDTKREIQVLYTTHSPHMVNLKQLWRVLAVQREDVEEHGSNTVILGIHNFSDASVDTLLPIYDLMGIDISHQRVIKEKNNVILEEVSAYYYMQAFFKLKNINKEVHFIPVKGTSRVEEMAYLFLGWGLEYQIILDDEKSGKKVKQNLKENLCLNKDECIDKIVHLIPNCNGIEDIFTKTDYRKYVLENESIKTDDDNSVYAKENGRPKAIDAYKFLIKVENKELMLNDKTFNKETITKIDRLVKAIVSKLE